MEWGGISVDAAEDNIEEVVDDDYEVLVSEEVLLDWAVNCLCKAGAEEGPARTQAKILLAADKRGHYSHGFNRLDIYCNDIISGVCQPNNTPVVENDKLAAALVDGRDGLGGVVGEYAMNVAIEKAKLTGVGWVTAKNSNHFGIAGHYSMMAERQGLIGFSFTNGSSWVTATRSAGARVMSTNPIAFAAPGVEGDSVVVDMATAAVAVGKIEIAAVTKQDLPHGWAVDGGGSVTTNPRTALREGAGLPLGGLEETGGYKGYGLAMMIEILCGVMSGGTWGPNIRPWGNTDQPGNLSHCFIVLDPAVCGTQFQARLQSMVDMFRNLEPSNPSKPVLVPGDPERNNEKMVKDNGGVKYSKLQFQRFVGFSKKMEVECPKHTKIIL